MQRLVALFLGLVLGVVGPAAFAPPAVPVVPASSASASAAASAAAAAVKAETAGDPDPGPLAGRVVVLDAGHQLGNHNFPRKISRKVPAGGFKKACNTVGTSTRAGLAEATAVWRITKRVRTRLRALGARVIMTRDSNRQDRWGPCVDERGRRGNKANADLKLSIHADGSFTAGARGFHVIAPTDRRRWTHDIYRPSRRLARVVRSGLRSVGLRVANYTAGGDGLDFRGDLGTLNLSNVPVAMVELGNMKDRRDARRLRTDRGQARYAKGLVRSVKRYLR